MRLAASDGRGQSIVELAISLPVLLLLLVGMADVARLYHYATAVTNAAREGAYFAAQRPNAMPAAITERVCMEMGFDATGCPSAVQVQVDRTPNDVRVQVSYRLSLLSGHFAARFFSVNPLDIRAAAAFPRLWP